MAHDVFVSYSHKDKPVADAIVAGLENIGIRCWFAPRDITPGSSWGDAIISAIEGCRFMVIVLSENSNRSRQVVREVERAVASNVIIIPFRIEAIDPTGAMAYFLSTEHWLDAITPPLEQHIDKLVATLQHFMSGDEKTAIRSLNPPRSQPAAPARWKPAQIWPVGLGILVLAIIAAFTLPRLLGNSPPASPTSATSSEPSSLPSTPIATLPATLLPTLTATATSTLTPTPEPAFQEIGNFPTSREARNVFVVDQLAYIANAEQGLLILDIQDPANPQEIGAFPMENAENVVVVEGIAYVVEQGLLKDNRAQNDRLVLVDVQDPAAPRSIGEFTPQGIFVHQNLSHLAVFDQKVYLATSDRLMIVDVSDPSKPVEVGEFTFFSNISSPGVAVEQGIAYLQANELHVIDVSDPAQAAEIGGYDSSWGASLVIQDQVAYIASWSNGLILLDISNPARPIKLGQYLEPAGNYELLPPGAAGRETLLDVALSGDIAYLSFNFGIDHSTWTQTLESGIVAVDISDPANPRKIAVFSGLDAVSSVAAAGDLVLVTDSSRGLFILSKPR